MELIQRLIYAGAQTIEATAFVDPKKVPQLADANEVSYLYCVCTALKSARRSQLRFISLVR